VIDGPESHAANRVAVEPALEAGRLAGPEREAGFAVFPRAGGVPLTVVPGRPRQ